MRRVNQEDQADRGPHGRRSCSQQVLMNRPQPVSPDGERFLMIKRVSAPTDELAGQQQVRLIQNWSHEPTERVPIN